MRRKVYDQLKKWKEEQNGESAVLINGARRVGKSYIVKEFAQKEYKSYILLDFNKIGKDIKSLFETYLDDLDTFFMYLSSFTNTPLYPRNSVIIFDEVQLYPRARTAIKYLVEDGRYDYIETGSLVSIKKNVENIMIPSDRFRRICRTPITKVLPNSATVKAISMHMITRITTSSSSICRTRS